MRLRTLLIALLFVPFVLLHACVGLPRFTMTLHELLYCEIVNSNQHASRSTPSCTVTVEDIFVQHAEGARMRPSSRVMPAAGPDQRRRHRSTGFRIARQGPSCGRLHPVVSSQSRDPSWRFLKGNHSAAGMRIQLGSPMPLRERVDLVEAWGLTGDARTPWWFACSSWTARHATR